MKSLQLKTRQKITKQSQLLAAYLISLRCFFIYIFCHSSFIINQTKSPIQMHPAQSYKRLSFTAQTSWPVELSIRRQTSSVPGHLPLDHRESENDYQTVQCLILLWRVWCPQLHFRESHACYQPLSSSVCCCLKSYCRDPTNLAESCLNMCSTAGMFVNINKS